MLNLETQTQIRQWFYAEHWKVGTIARELGVHPHPCAVLSRTARPVVNRLCALVRPIPTSSSCELLSRTIPDCGPSVFSRWSAIAATREASCSCGAW
jgi:hypothetical protein